MHLFRIAALAALAFAATSQAGAQTCGLRLMASLDMTVLPEGRVAVPVSINGTPHPFMVDTAGVYSRVSDGVVQQLGLKTTPTSQELYGVNGRERISVVDIESLKIGGNEAKHFHLAVGGLHAPGESKYDGVLAGDLLTLFDVEFDFAGKKVNFFSQDHCAGKVVYWTQSGYAEIPFHLSAGSEHIDFRMTLDGHEVSTDLDTGSATTWIRHKSALQIFDLDEHSPGMERVGGNDEAPVFRKQFGMLQLGGVTVQNPQVLIIEDRAEQAFRNEHSEKSRDDPIYGTQMEIEALTLGMTTLSKLRFYIAYKEHMIYVTAVDAH